jgi:hypothetical protein
MLNLYKAGDCMCSGGLTVEAIADQAPYGVSPGHRLRVAYSGTAHYISYVKSFKPVLYNSC